MNLYSLAVFLHVVSDIGVFVAVGATLYGLASLRQAAHMETVRPIAALMLRAERIYGLAGPLLLLSGAYLTLTAWSWATSWIAVALGCILILFPIGPILVSPRLAAISRTAQAAPDGPLPADLHARIHDPLLGIVQQGLAGLLLGIVFLMTVKPALGPSILVIACGLALGLASAIPGFAGPASPARVGVSTVGPSNSLPPPAPASPGNVRAAIRLDLEQARTDFHGLVADLTGEWSRPSANPGWTNGEVLFHMTLGFMILAALVPLMRIFGRLPSWVSRTFAQVLDAGTPLFNWVNALGARGGGRLHDFASRGARFDHAYHCLVRLLDRLPEVEWQRSMHYPRRWDPLFHSPMTIEAAFRYTLDHFSFHKGQISF